MKIQILAEDVAKASRYGDTEECLMCQILKRLGYTKVQVGAYTITTNSDSFSFDGARFHEIAYGKDNSKARIESAGTEFELIKRP